MQERIVKIVPRLSEEKLIEELLAANDEMNTAFTRYHRWTTSVIIILPYWLTKEKDGSGSVSPLGYDVRSAVYRFERRITNGPNTAEKVKTVILELAVIPPSQCSTLILWNGFIRDVQYVAFCLSEPHVRQPGRPRSDSWVHQPITGRVSYQWQLTQPIKSWQFVQSDGQT